LINEIAFALWYKTFNDGYALNLSIAASLLFFGGAGILLSGLIGEAPSKPQQISALFLLIAGVAVIIASMVLVEWNVYGGVLATADSDTGVPIVYGSWQRSYVVTHPALIISHIAYFLLYLSLLSNIIVVG
jgi:hypothetical protein